MKHLLILLVSVEGNDRNTVINLEREGKDRVVNDNEIFEISVFDDPQVLYVVAFLSLDAVVSVQSVLKVVVVWVNVI